MKLALILNPYSGGKMGKKKLPEITDRLSSHQISFDIIISEYHEHIFELCANLDVAAYDGIVGIGGDGTNFQVINGLLQSNAPNVLPPIGVLPVGSGNSFAKDLNIESLADGLDAIAGKKSRSVDVCSYTAGNRPVYFVNLMGFGFVTDAADTARKFKFLKDASYVIGVLHRTISLSYHQLDMEVDGQKIKGDNCFVEFCNSRYTGGNMLMAPEAEIDDGLMDIIIAGPLSRTSLLATLPKIYTGDHIQHPAVQYIKAKKVVVRTVPEKKCLPDGEIYGSTPTTIQVHHKMLRYFA
jgi:diacylglycerol kinase (ATP)